MTHTATTSLQHEQLTCSRARKCQLIAKVGCTVYANFSKVMRKQEPGLTQPGEEVLLTRFWILRVGPIQRVQVLQQNSCTKSSSPPHVLTDLHQSKNTHTHQTAGEVSRYLAVCSPAVQNLYYTVCPPITV